jgi:hypothetical protein
LLRESDQDRSKLIEAAHLLVALSEKTNDDSRQTEINSLLYWTKKQMTVAEASAFAASNRKAAAVVDRVVDRRVEREDASDWLRRAEAYARTTEDPLLKAIRYWEVADRFVGTPESLRAQERSLALMKQVATSLGRQDRVVGELADGAGRLFVDSDPKGAAVFIDFGEGLRSTGAETPAMVRPPRGEIAVSLRKEGYEEGKASIFVGDSTVRLGPVILQRLQYPVEIVTRSPDWWVYLNGEPALEADGSLARTPCTIFAEAGQQKIAVVKDGCRDQTKRVTVEKPGGEGRTEVVFDARASRGRSDVMKSALALRGPKALATTEGLKITPGKGASFAYASGVVRPPFRVTALVKTDNKEIKFAICKGFVNFSWGPDPDQLRLHDFLTGAKSGVRGKGGVPPDTYVRIDIACSASGFLIAVNGKERFSRKADYSRLSGKVGIGTFRESTITVKSFTVSRRLQIQ